MMSENIALVVSEFNSEITDRMKQKAIEQIKEGGAEVKEVVSVPGAFEIPLATKRLIGKDDVDGIITLGCIIQGDTSHDEVIAHAIAKKLLDLSIEFDKPVSLGISGPRMKRKEAEKRAEEYAIRASETVIRVLRGLK